MNKIEGNAILISTFKRAARKKGFLHLLLDILIHKLLINADPRDYLYNGFFADGDSMEEKGRYISLRGSRYFPYANNPLKLNSVFTNKYIQKSILQYLHIPTTGLVSTIGAELQIRDSKQLNAFLDNLTTDVFIKPISGTHGHGIMAVIPRGGHLYSAGGMISKEKIWNHCQSDFQKGYLVEEKISNAQEISAIHSSSLNTYRIITIKTKDKKWHNAFSYIKFGQKGNQVDNLLAGGIMAVVNTHGKIASAFDYLRYKPTTQHPDSGRELVGMELKDFQEVEKLALQSSAKMDFLGTIGWDIAYSDKGPLVIEANGWWGNQFQAVIGKGIITDELARGLKKRTIFSRWDKTMMHPGFYKKPIIFRLRDKIKIILENYRRAPYQLHA